jgi:transposase
VSTITGDHYDVASHLKRKKDAKVIISPLALEALQRIDRIFDIERGINFA